MLISACNPYRKIEENKDMCRLSLSDDIDNKLVHLIQPISNHFYFIFLDLVLLMTKIKIVI